MDLRDIISELGIASGEEMAGIPPDEDLVKRVAELKSVPEDEVLFAIGKKLGIPYVKLSPRLIDPEVAKLIPAELCRSHFMLPMLATEGEITVVFADPTDSRAEADVVAITGRRVNKAIGSRDDILRCIDAIWGKGTVPSPAAGDTSKEAPPELIEDKSGTTFVYFHLTQAVEEEVEEISVRPSGGAAKVSYRVGGRLIPRGEIPLGLLAGITSRIRIMAGMEFPEKPAFQEGRLRTEILGRPILVEVYIAPLINGESIVLKLLDMTGGGGGMLPPEARVGIVSPKAQAWADMDDCGAIDLSLLVRDRYQPMRAISEIFDVVIWDDYPEPELIKELFSISQDRNLVVFRLPLNSSLRGLEYLREIGVPPVVITSSLLFIMAERSFPKLCPRCREETSGEGGTRRFVPSGCESCNGIGFIGSLRLSEVLTISDEIEDAILSGMPYRKLKEIAERSGFRSISSAASELASSGEIYLDPAEP